jgi:hypothetical protein
VSRRIVAGLAQTISGVVQKLFVLGGMGAVAVRTAPVRHGFVHLHAICDEFGRCKPLVTADAQLLGRHT